MNTNVIKTIFEFYGRILNSIECFGPIDVNQEMWQNNNNKLPVVRTWIYFLSQVKYP